MLARLTSLLLLPLVSCGIFGWGGTPAPLECGSTPIEPDEGGKFGKIVGGSISVPYSWPWQAELCMKSQWAPESCDFRCGASLIDNQYVMTASHCVHGYDTAPEVFGVKLGIYDYNSTKEEGAITSNVAAVIMHPNYGKPHQYSHDIAILKLENPVEYTDHIQPICIPENSRGLFKEGHSAFVTGWGATVEGGMVSTHLRQVLVPFLTMHHCEREYRGMIDESMECAGRTGLDSCQGDSGGPLVVKHKDSGRWFQAGIVSWGQGCAEKGHAGVYARSSSFCGFLKATVGRELCHK